jgi:type II secretory pathway component GspD/PulD (secretin)
MTSDNSSRLRELSRLLAVVTLPAVIILASWASAQDTPESDHFMSRTVRDISPEQAIGFITQANLGTASRIPNTQTILITAKTSDLAKAKTLLELVDSKEHYKVVLLPADQEFTAAVRQEKITERLTDLSLATFAALPPPGEKPRVLVDLLDDSVIVAAPASHLEQVLSALEEIREPQTTVEPAEPNQPAVTEAPPAGTSAVTEVNKPGENDQFFNQILDSLVEAERVEAALKAAETQAPEPTAETRQAKAPSAQQEFPEQPVQEPQPESAPTKIIELTPKETGPTIKKLSYEPALTELANEQLELNLPETINVVELIDLVGKYLNLNLLYDPKEVAGQVTLRVQGKIKVGELYPLLESVLKFRGFAMTRKDNLVTIVPIGKVMETDPVLFDTGEKKLQFGNVIVTRVFDLEYVDTTSAENLLKDMKLGEHIKGIPDAGKLIVTDYAYRMNRIEELLSIIDQPGEGKQFRYRQLRYTMAPSLASQVETLAEQLGTIKISVAAPTEPTPAAPTRGRRVRPRPTPTPTPETAEPEVYLDADERTNRILMIGLPEQLDIVETLIDSLDVAQQDLRTLRLYDIQYAGAEEVVEKLQELGIISGGRRTTLTGRITAPQKGQPAQETPATVLTEEGLVEEPQIVIIESTNSLLVNATAEQHAQIATIISYVDAEPQQSATNYIVYPLENQDPDILANVLKQLIQETIEEQGQDSKIVRTTRRKLEEDITIIAEPTTYSIVVYAGKKHQQWIANLINQLDRRRPQVLIDVTLVEISKNDEFNYDLNLIQSFPDLVTTSGLANIIVPGETPFTTDDIISKLQSSNRDRFIDLQSNSGQGTAFYGDKHINALLELVQSKSYGRVLARPKLLVNDNEEGTIEAKETTYRKRTESSQVPTTGGETGYVLTQQIVFDAYDAGIALAIKPHISEGDLLKLEITLTRSDFRETAASLATTDPTPPDRITSDVTTIITVPDKSTIILGGLERLTQSKGGSKVPLLGDVPIVGGLFRSVANSDDQSRLYVFVKAHIIRPEEKLTGRSDIEVVSAKNRATFEKYEKQMQEYEDWPGIKPQPMDPLKVLEGD